MTLRQKIDLKNALLFSLPWIVGFLVFVAYPILASLYFSFCDYSVLSPPRWVGTANYVEVFQSSIAVRAMVRTVAFAVVALPLSLLASLILALLLERSARGIGVFRTAFFLPALVPQVAVAALLMWMFATDGVVNSVLNWLGLGVVPWMGRDMILVTLLVTGMWTVGHAMVIFIAGLHEVPAELYESAQIDGATYFRRVLNISIPMISPVILFNLVMGVIGALSQFTIPYFIGSSNTSLELGDATNFIATEVYDQAIQNLRMGYASALSWVLLVVVVLLTALIFRVSTRVVHYQSE